ncbi:MAG: PH domain-containing protein [Muribaculaceae bacterium]|nr:PH domain-containing protein [Muribaculaceae bacterium]
MISKVKFSKFSIILTWGVIGLLCVGIICSWGIPKKVITGSVILAAMIVSGMFYAPRSIELTEDCLIIRSMLKKKCIPLSEIALAERCYPSGGGIRICASGGFMGYWGYFNDIVIGTYFGYFGDRDQCILLRLTNKRQYVISCENPDEMLMEIDRRIN